MAILGIDEVGRGPLAGPLVVGAVILPERETTVSPERETAGLPREETTILVKRETTVLLEKKSPSLDWIAELKDSKKLTPKKREKYAEIIMEEAPATGLGWVSAVEIDKIGIAAALKLAVRRAVKEVQKQKVPFSEIIIDGKVNFLKDTRLSPYVTTLIKADDLIKEVSAASIIAKVARDRYMTECAACFPGYLFEKNMGYGTAAHLKALLELGPCPEHRQSFEPLKSQLGLKNFPNNLAANFEQTISGGEKINCASVCSGDFIKNVAFSNKNSEKLKKNTTFVGRKGEKAVAEYLLGHGHQIVVQNFKTKTCEIDLVSVKDDKIYFTEVKYRQTCVAGSGLEAITKKKLAQMTYAAQVFLKLNPRYRNFSPMLAAAAVTGKDFRVKEWVKILS